MAYVKQNWENSPSTASPLSADRLNHLETQYDEAVSYANSLITESSYSPIDNLQWPLFIAHRGANRRFPEHSIEGYRAAYEAGFSPEADLNLLQDGTLVCIHDDTCDRTMNISGPVGEKSVNDWRNARIKPAAAEGRVFSSQWGTPVFFDEYLDEFGGKIVLWPEVKDSAAASAAIDAVISRGLQKWVVFQSFDLDVCRQVTTAGLRALHLGITSTPQDIVEAGVEFVGVNVSAVTDLYISQLRDKGLRVIGYTVNSRQAALDQFARGVDGVFSDDVWAVSKEFTPQTNLDLSSGFIPADVKWTGRVPPVDAAVTARFENGVIRYTQPASPTPVNVHNLLKLGSFGYGGASAKVRFWAQGFPQVGGSPSGSQWLFGLYLGKSVDDGPVQEDAGRDIFRLAMVRYNGQKVCYEKRSSEDPVTNLGSTSVPSSRYVPEGGRSIPMLFEVEFTPTSITTRNLTLNDADLTVSHAAWPASEDLYITLGGNGGEIRLWDISVTR